MDAGVGTSTPFTPGVRAGGRVRDQRAASMAPDWSVGAIEHGVSANYFEASALWPGVNPIGLTIDWNGARPATVIGVVGDVRGAAGQGPRGGGLDLDPGPAAYFAVTQQPLSAMTLVVRTSDDSTATASLLRQATQAIDAAQPVTQVRRLRQWLDQTVAEPRFTSFLSGAFARRRADPRSGFTACSPARSHSARRR